MPKKILSENNVSKEFSCAFTDAGSLVSVTCDFCGRVHFCDPDIAKGDYNDGEYEYLLEQASIDPDAYVFGGGCISYGYLAGHCYVPDCKCNAGVNYENFLLSHQNKILDFFKSVATRKIEEAAEINERLKP